MLNWEEKKYAEFGKKFLEFYKNRIFTHRKI